MGLNFQNLDAETRRLMVDEIEHDRAGRGLYLSNYLTDAGKKLWPDLLRQAASEGTDDALAGALNYQGCFRTHSERKTKNGIAMVAVPHTAAQTLSQSQFNMYYMRALAIRAKAERRRLVVYRAKEAERPRPESEAMIGTSLDPDTVLTALRETMGVEPPIGIPLPNSGLTVRLE